MAKCRACGKFLSALGAATCRCSATYHKPCVAIPEDSLTPTDWMCPECKCRMPKSGNVATPVKGIVTDCTVIQRNMPTTVERTSMPEGNVTNQSPESGTSMSSETQLFGIELGREIRLFREDLREVRQEFKDLRQEISDLRSLLSRSNDRINGLESRIITLESQKETDSSSKVSALEQTIFNLKLEMNDRQQEVLQTDIEVSNLPEMTGENGIQTAMVLAAKLGVSLKREDIVFAERVGKTFDEKKGETKRNRRLVVRLSRRQLRDEFIQSARVRRGATSADMGIDQPPQRFYVNERLTAVNRKLFYSTREAAKSLQWKFTWTKRGRIHTRQGEGKPIHTIRSENDLVRVFGSSNVGNASELRT